jgi:regulator of PEP synthase PpsR (kinase-PPPase family)
MIARLGGLDPAKCFRGINLRNICLKGIDLREIDFSSADLRGTFLRHAICDNSTIFGDALIDLIDRKYLVASGILASREKSKDPIRPSFFHLHLISDSTGETLITVSRSAASQFIPAAAVSHVYPAVRTSKQLDRVLYELEAAPGIVLYTLLDESLAQLVESRCQNLGFPCLFVIDPVIRLFGSYLGSIQSLKVGRQHIERVPVSKRSAALYYTARYVRNKSSRGLKDAEVIAVCLSEQSTIPLALCLGLRAVKVRIVQLTPGNAADLPADAENALVIGVLTHGDGAAFSPITPESDIESIASWREAERYLQKLCIWNHWPLIDAKHRSIDEAAAEVLALLARMVSFDPESHEIKNTWLAT